MEAHKSIVSYTVAEYGHVKVKLAELLKKNHITRNALGQRIGVKFETVDRYYQGESIEMADLDFLAKVCYVMDCKIEDLLEYEAPEETDN